MERREFLKLLAAGALGMALPGCSEKITSLFGSENEGFWGLNVHPYGGSLLGLQIQALQALGIQKVRITMGLGRDLAGSYIRSYPAEYVGLVSDYDLGGVTPRSWPGLVRDVVGRAGSVSFLEILNEPQLFLQLSAGDYVRDYLQPAYEIIKESRPDISVVAAAPRGTQDGQLYFYDMTDAGADRYCDFRGVHLYSNSAESYLFGSDRPFMVTETGSANPANHIGWWKDDMSHFSSVLETDHLYFYVLLDQPHTGNSIISETPDSRGQVVPVSPLYSYILDTY